MSFFGFFFLVVVQPCFHSRNIHRRRRDHSIGCASCDIERIRVLIYMHRLSNVGHAASRSDRYNRRTGAHCPLSGQHHPAGAYHRIRGTAPLHGETVPHSTAQASSHARGTWCKSFRRQGGYTLVPESVSSRPTSKFITPFLCVRWGCISSSPRRALHVFKKFAACFIGCSVMGVIVHNRT